MMSKKVDAQATEQLAYEPRQLYTLNLKDLNPDPSQPRKYINETELNELAESIKKHGVLQPILFRQDQDGKRVIISGERRYQASKLAKKETIPAIYAEGNASEIALVENLLRVDLTPIEEAEGLQKLQNEAKYSNKDLAAVIGKAESTISEILSLTKLPEAIKNDIRSNKEYSRRQLVEVAKGKDDKEMKKLFRSLKKKDVTRDQIREKRHRDVEAVFKTMINGLTTKLNEVDLQDLNAEKRNEIRNQLLHLVELISRKTN
ncbi:MAG: ParB/RepB/Spo0J family partition protein [Geobacteraceae bacterium]|nr:ParB/RepB/Spo0J family partition protein [Geobacteraceae bacterium]